ERAHERRLAAATVAGVDVEDARQTVATETRVLPQVGKHIEAVVAELVEGAAHARLERDGGRVRGHVLHDGWVRSRRAADEVLDVRARREDAVRQDLRTFVRGRARRIAGWRIRRAKTGAGSGIAADVRLVDWAVRIDHVTPVHRLSERRRQPT